MASTDSVARLSLPRGASGWLKTCAGCVMTAGVVVFAVSADAEAIGDVDTGAAIFDSDCASCHEIGDGARNRIGPHLNAIYDRGAAAIADYDYSDAMLRAGDDGLAWNSETLDVYLTNPKNLVSRTKMSYAGLEDEASRSHVIAYLRSFSARPSDIPEAAPTARQSDIALTPEIMAIRGDPAYGEYLSSECTGCHRTDGADEGIPSITNWPAQDFVLAMHAYKEQHRPHPVMQMMAGRLSNDEIAALAAFFETIE